MYIQAAAASDLGEGGVGQKAFVPVFDNARCLLGNVCVCTGRSLRENNRTAL